METGKIIMGDDSNKLVQNEMIKKSYLGLE
jgi:ABC-type lipopolysaccharide export system ATPase subunit